MPLPLVLLATAAGSFVCEQPSHHDGDNLRCANMPGAMRLQGIDAPEMPGACRPGRRCVAGDPFAARDHLRSLTRGKTLQCRQEDTDSYGRAIVVCMAGAVNINCAMIESGHAEARYAPLACGQPPAPLAGAADRVIVPADTPAPAVLPVPTPGLPLLLIIGLALVNIVTWALFALDKRRAVAGRSRERIAEATLLGWAALGGAPAAWHAVTQLRHKSSKDSFKLRLLLISGVQGGLLIGGLYWWLAG